MITVGQWMIEPPSFWKWCGESHTPWDLHVLYQGLTNPGAGRLPESWPYQLAWLLYLPSLATQRMKNPNLSRVFTKKPSHLDLFPCESQSPYFPVRMFWRCMSTEHHGIPNCLQPAPCCGCSTEAMATSTVPDWVIRTLLPERVLLPVITWECS